MHPTTSIAERLDAERPSLGWAIKQTPSTILDRAEVLRSMVLQALELLAAIVPTFEDHILDPGISPSGAPDAPSRFLGEKSALSLLGLVRGSINTPNLTGGGTSTSTHTPKTTSSPQQHTSEQHKDRFIRMTSELTHDNAGFVPFDSCSCIGKGYDYFMAILQILKGFDFRSN